MIGFIARSNFSDDERCQNNYRTRPLMRNDPVAAGTCKNIFVNMRRVIARVGKQESRSTGGGFLKRKLRAARGQRKAITFGLRLTRNPPLIARTAMANRPSSNVVIRAASSIRTYRLTLAGDNRAIYYASIRNRLTASFAALSRARARACIRNFA